jgi:ketosteroid isomerase-like protein
VRLCGFNAGIVPVLVVIIVHMGVFVHDGLVNMLMLVALTKHQGDADDHRDTRHHLHRGQRLGLLVGGAELFAENAGAAGRRLGISGFAVGLLLAGAEPEEPGRPAPDAHNSQRDLACCPCQRQGKCSATLRKRPGRVRRESSDPFASGLLLMLQSVPDSRGAVMADSKDDIIRRGYKAFGEGDMETLGSLYTPDVVQRQPGNNQTSGEYKGVANVLGLYGKLFELSGGTFSVDLKSVKSQGDKVVSVHHSKAEHEGKTLDADETIEFTFSGDKISRLDVTYADQDAEDAFWG